MKKTFLTLFLMTTMFGAAYADGREKPTSVDKLPQAAQEFLSAHFKDLTVAYAVEEQKYTCLLYTSPSPRDISGSRMPSSA